MELYDACFSTAYKSILPSYVSLDTLKKKALENFSLIIKNETVLVAEDANKLLAFVVLRTKSTEIGEIVCLYVEPKYQRQGIASALVEASFQKLLSLGVSGVTISVFENNYPALELYKKLGFKESGTKIGRFLSLKHIQLQKELKQLG